MPVALPASLPAPAYDGNVQEEADIAETCEFESGEARRSPIYRSVPNVVRWSWMLTQAEFDDYADWFEDALQAGALSFSLPVVQQGGSFATTTTEALFSAPPTETQIAPDVWRVDAVAVTGVGFPPYVYAPLVVGAWAEDEADNLRPIHALGAMEYRAGYLDTGISTHTSFAAAAAANALVSRGIDSNQAYSVNYIGYTTSLSGPSTKPNRFLGGANLAGNPQYINYFMAGAYPTEIADEGGGPTHTFPDSAIWCGDMRLYGATPNDGLVYWTTDGLGADPYSEAQSGQYVSRLGGVGGSISEYAPAFTFINNCINVSGSPFAHGSYIIRMRAERAPDAPDPSYTVVAETAKQLCAVEYRGGALYQNALGPVLLVGDPNYDNADFWDAAADSAILAGDMQADVDYPVVVDRVARAG